MGGLLEAWRANPTSDAAIALCRALTTGPPASPEERATLLQVGSSILVQHSDDVEVLLALGRLYLAAGEYLHADAALKRVLEATLSDARAWRLLGEVFLRAGNARDAQKAFEGAVTRGMNDPGTLTWLLRAKRYIALQDARGVAAVAADLARGGTGGTPSDDAMVETGGETLVAPSMHDEPTMVAPGLATSAPAMAMSVPDASVVLLAPTPRLGTEAVRALTEEAEAAAAAPEARRPSPPSEPDPSKLQAQPAAKQQAPDAGAPPRAEGAGEQADDGASPDSARTLLYERPNPPAERPERPERDSDPSSTLPDVPNAKPRPAVPRPAPSVPRPDPKGDKRPTLVAPLVAPSPATGVELSRTLAGGATAPDPAPKTDDAPQPPKVLDEMSMSIHMLRENDVPESSRELNAYIGAMRRSEGIEVGADTDEPTHNVGRPLAQQAADYAAQKAAQQAAQHGLQPPAGSPSPYLNAPNPGELPPRGFNPMGGGTIPMMAMEDVRRAEQAYAAQNSPAGLAQAAAPFVPPNPPSPGGQGLPSVVLNPHQGSSGPGAHQPGLDPAHMYPPHATPIPGPPRPVLPPPVQLAPTPTLVPMRPAPRRAGVVVVVLLAVLVVVLSCAWVYLRYLRPG